MRASDIIAGKDTLITGRNVDIESKDNTYRGKEEHEYKKSGLTASLGGTVMNAARSMTAPMKRAGEVKDSRLKALYAYEAGKNLKQASDTFHSVKDVKKGLALTVGVGSMKSESHSLRTGTEAASSTLAAGGNVSVTADRDITVKGSTITGEKVNLKAGRNIYVQAEESTRTARTDEKAKGGAVSVSFGASGFQGLSASYGKGTNHETETTLTHAGSRIKAGDTLAVDSGKDTVITGSLLKGKYVSVHTGGDLSIESLQDSKTYTQNGKSIGLGIGTNLTKAGTVVQAGKGKENTDSTYRSVTEQAGIYAGSKGYDITVKGNTHLTGAVIDSKAEKEKNKLTTGTLTWEDIENKASYESHGKTQTVSSDKVSSSNPLGASVAMAVPVQGSHSSITRVAIADGIIQTTEGKTEKEISRDTKNTLNKLAEIFDKKSVQEKQELIGLIAKEGFTLVGDIATRKQESLRTKAAEARTHNNEAKAESYEKEAAKWAENGINRIALHGIVGALVSKEAGTGMTKGLTGAGLNALLQKEPGKIKDKEVHKIASAAIRYLAGGKTGAAIAHQATTFNYLTHEQYEQYLGDMKNAKTEEEKKRLQKDREAIDERQRYSPISTPGTYWDFKTGRPFTVKEGGNLFEPVLVTATRAHGETIFESAMSSAINAKIAKYLGRETVIGDALTLPWDIANDANIDKYGIQGVKRRIGMDIYGNLIVMFAGAKIGGIKGGSTGIFSVLGLTEIKEAIAPPLIENERKQADDSYLREINSNVID